MQTTETDRELLELAAKAADLKNHTWDGYGIREQAVHGVPHCGHRGPEWNPLTDDGDALRLAVKLRIPFENDEFGALIDVVGRIYEAYKDHGGDENSTTRRAIVRASAEIGRVQCKL